MGLLHDTRTELWNQRNRLLTTVLVFDQFEEIFTVGRQIPSVDILIDELAALIQNWAPDSVRRAIEADPELACQYDFVRENCKVIFALREDYLPDLEDLRDRMPSVMANRMRLTRMTGAQARDVVLKSDGHLIAEGWQRKSSILLPRAVAAVLDRAAMSIAHISKLSRRISASSANS